MNKVNKQNLPITILEFSIVLVMWLIIIISPLITKTRDGVTVSHILIESMVSTAPFFIYFLINHLIIVPKLLFKRKRLAFTICSAILLIAFTAIQVNIRTQEFKDSVKSSAVVRFEKKIFDAKYTTYTKGFLSKSHNGQRFVISQNTYKNKLDSSIAIEGTTHTLFRKRPTSIFRLEPPPLVLKNQVSFYMQGTPSKSQILASLPYFDRDFSRPMRQISFFTLSFVLVVFGLSTGIRVIFHWLKLEKESIAIENQSIKNELNFLKSQISPHFFMNTLNNIHSLIDIDTEKSQVAIVEFSKLMRYMLYDSETDRTDLLQEIEFLENYVNLMKLRFTDEVKISIKKPQIDTKIPIAPLLFTSLLENSFKHGVSYQKQSFIEIEFAVDDKWISFKCSNSNFSKPSKEVGGIGIENTKKRLDLIYANRYEFNIDKNDEIFTVFVRIPHDKMHCN